MKYIKPKLMPVIVLLLTLAALPAHADMKNEPKGYGGFKWNTSAKNIFGQYKKNLIMTGDSGHFEIFKNKKEADEFDDIEKSDGWIRSGGGKWRGKKTFVKIRGSLYGSKDESVSGKIIIGLKEYDGYI